MILELINYLLSLALFFLMFVVPFYIILHTLILLRLKDDHK